MVPGLVSVEEAVSNPSLNNFSQNSADVSNSVLNVKRKLCEDFSLHRTRFHSNLKAYLMPRLKFTVFNVLNNRIFMQPDNS